LDEAISSPDPLGSTWLATQEDLNHTVDDIKASIGTQLLCPPPSSYANDIKGPAKTFHPLTSKPTASAEAQERDIPISLKKTNKNLPFASILPTTLTDKLNELLAAFFKNPSNGGLDILAPNCSTSWLANGNLILTFKTKDGAQQARAHLDNWVKLIDPRATAPHHIYAVVAHNIPASIWNDPTMLWEAMMEM